MMLVSLPIVDQVVVPSDESMITRVRAAVARIAVEDAHLVVDEVDVVEARIERPERLAQRGVEGVDRAVAVGRRVEHLAGHLDLDGRLGEQLAAVALLDEHGEVDDPERRHVVGRVAADEQLERRLGALERQPLVLELLDELRELARVDDALELVAELAGTDRGVGPAAELRHDQPAGIPDQRRIDVLVAPLDLRDGRAVDAALVGERRATDVRLVVVRGDVGDLGHGPRQLGQPGQPPPPAGTSWCGVLRARFARIDTMFALPARSP